LRDQLIHAHPHIHAPVTEGVFLPDGTFLPLPKFATEPFPQALGGDRDGRTPAFVGKRAR
jgi:hypothetical protein